MYSPKHFFTNEEKRRRRRRRHRGKQQQQPTWTHTSREPDNWRDNGHVTGSRPTFGLRMSEPQYLEATYELAVGTVEFLFM